VANELCKEEECSKIARQAVNHSDDMVKKYIASGLVSLSPDIAQSIVESQGKITELGREISEAIIEQLPTSAE